MRQQFLIKVTVGAFVLGTMFFSAYVRADVEKDGYGFLHSNPRATDYYTSTVAVPFSDGTTFTARRVATLQTPENITVYSKDGYDSTLVSSTTNAHAWSGTDITDWSDTGSIDGSALVSTGNHGYWAKITETDTTIGTTETLWQSALDGTNAYRSGTFTVVP